MAKKTEVSRAERKAKKRAAEDAIPDLPGDENVQDEVEVEVEVESSSKKNKKRKRNKDREEAAEMNGEKESKKLKKEKRRKEEDQEAETGDAPEVVEGEKVVKKSRKDKKDKVVVEEAPPPADPDAVMADADELPKKSKKERKAERRATELAAKANPESKPAGAADSNGETKPEASAETETNLKSKKNNRNRDKKRKGENGTTSTNGDDAKVKEGKAARFIVFVGNLPFTATRDSLSAHFARVHPASVRLLTKKEDPSKSKGCAFVEFDGYDHMKTCLKLMHHSTFDDGLSAARKINVELTAGGGGNTKDRKAKIKSKNVKLNEERVRKIHEEEKAKAQKAMEGGKTGAASIDESAVHPSRRRYVPAAA